MKIQNVLLAILVAICAGCDKESPSESFETGDVVLNIISTDSSTDVDSFSQYTVEIIPEAPGEIVVGKLKNLTWPHALRCGYYRIEMYSSVVYVENNTDYRYYGLSEVFKVEPNKTITVPIEIKLSAFHVESKENKGAGTPAPTYMNIAMKAGINSVLPSFRKSFVYSK